MGSEWPRPLQSGAASCCNLPLQRLAALLQNQIGSLCRGSLHRLATHPLPSLEFMEMLLFISVGIGLHLLAHLTEPGHSMATIQFWIDTFFVTSAN